MKNILFLSLFILFMSCSKSVDIPKVQTKSELFTQTAHNFSKSYRYTSSKELDLEGKKESKSVYIPAKYYDNFLFKNDWKIPYQKFVSLLNENKQFALITFEQSTACILLDEYLLKANPNKEVLNAIDFCVNLLLKRKNTEVLLIDKSLTKLKNHWNEEKISLAKNKIKEIAKTKLLNSNTIYEQEKQEIKEKIMN